VPSSLLLLCFVICSAGEVEGTRRSKVHPVMRLLQALSASNPTGNGSATNRSGKHTVRVRNIVGAPDLDAYEVDDANPTESPVSGPLYTSVSTDDIEDFFAHHGYNLDPEEWYPG
jgi:hypothetical protein